MTGVILNYSSLAGQLTAELARQTNTDAGDWFLVYRARYGMEVVFCTLKERSEHNEVVTQSFTCATAINPILAAKCRPVYADIDPDTLSIQSGSVRCSGQTAAIVMQHTFGIPADMVGARKVCDRSGVLLLEDSAHRVGYMARDVAGKPLADVSVHSFGAEKSLPTRFAGAVWVNPAMQDVTYAKALREALSTLPATNKRTAGIARLYGPTNGILNRLPRALSLPLRSTVARAGLFTPPIAPRELQGHQAAYPALPTAWMVKQVIQALADLPTLEQRRQTAAAIYGAASKTADIAVPKGAQQAAPYVRFPVVLPDAATANELFAGLRSRGVYAGKWYRPTLFPGVVSRQAYYYDAARCPIAEDVSSRIINLPTNVDAATAQEIANVVFS